MALPLIAATIARVAATKAAQRVVGGIVGKGGKSVQPVYNELERKAKKQAIAFTTGAAATTGGIAYKYNTKSEEARRNKK